MKHVHLNFSRKRNKTTCFIFCTIGLILIYASIPLGNASLGQSAILFFLNSSKKLAYTLFYLDLLLIVVSFLLALYYMPNKREFAWFVKLTKTSSDFFSLDFFYIILFAIKNSLILLNIFACHWDVGCMPSSRSCIFNVFITSINKILFALQKSFISSL